MIARVALMLLLTATAASAQDALTARVMAAVKASMAAALPYPETDEDGVVPANNSTTAEWMVRYPRDGERVIEVIANPLNVANQQKATAAMAEIEGNIAAAQRRATVQYESAVAEAKRTGRSQAVDGVTLSDEGVAGERIDAESHVTIEVLFNEKDYRIRVPGRAGLGRFADFPHRDIVVLSNAAHDYRDERRVERYGEYHSIAFLGRLSAPEVTFQGDAAAFDVTSAATEPGSGQLQNVVIHFRGNKDLIPAIVARMDWPQLLELLK